MSQSRDVIAAQYELKTRAERSGMEGRSQHGSSREGIGTAGAMLQGHDMPGNIERRRRVSRSLEIPLKCVAENQNRGIIGPISNPEGISISPRGSRVSVGPDVL